MTNVPDQKFDRLYALAIAAQLINEQRQLLLSNPQPASFDLMKLDQYWKSEIALRQMMTELG